MRLKVYCLLLFALILASPSIARTGAPADAAAPARAPEILVGVGLVVGLPGTGDSEIDESVVESSIVGLLRRAGIDPWRGEMKPGRVARVMVAAELPAGAQEGAPIGLTLTPIGDAATLAGGILLPTPLRDPDGVVQAVGQGPVEIRRDIATVPQPPPSPGEPREVAVAEGTILPAGGPPEIVAE
jgi:flagellar P-ring protein precursor FlgI